MRVSDWSSDVFSSDLEHYALAADIDHRVRGPEVDCHVLGIELEPARKEGHRYCFLSSKPPPGWRAPLSLSSSLAFPASGPNQGKIPARPRAAGWTGRSGCAGGSRFASDCARRDRKSTGRNSSH